MGKPKTTSTTPNAIRIRDNQRRSRARHREYVETMQRKLQDYEQRGVEATLQMQRAARDVAAENALLRRLLARKGVREGEVDRWIKSGGKDGDEENNEDDDEAREGEGEVTASAMEERSEGTLPDAPGRPDQANVGRANPPPPPLVDKLSVLADASASACCGGATRCAGIPTPGTSPGAFAPSTHSDSRPTTSTPKSLDAGHPLEMSCNAAARIITDMHGHGDREHAKTALGCEGQSECLVKNTKLFQVLDRE